MEGRAQIPDAGYKMKKHTQQTAGLKHGYRSGLEERIALEIAAAGITVEYESTKILYVTPQTLHKYTPDFVLPNGIVIETKGRFLQSDRKKHLLIKEQHPDIDIRFVFTNSKAKISKVSKTTYGMWCEKYGFKYTDKQIPKEWLK